MARQPQPRRWRFYREQSRRIDVLLRAARIWQALPQELLLTILSMLPVRVLARMRTLSREWNELIVSLDALQRIDLNLEVQSFPGLLLQLDWDTLCLTGTWVIEYLGGDSSGMNIYKAPLPVDDVIVGACRNIYFSHRRGNILDVCIGNLATGSRRPLPSPQVLRWDFTAMDFDATRRRCTVVLGQNTIQWGQEAHNMLVMEMYESESNEWTVFVMTVPLLIWPSGKGILSRGKIYWLGVAGVIAFTIAERRWAQIGFPPVCSCNVQPKRLELGGSDGRVFLIVYSLYCLCSCMWSLKEGPGAPEWCEPNEIWTPDTPNEFIFGANSSGWMMIFNWEMKTTICNPKQKLLRRNILPFLRSLPFPSRFFVSDFESNNVYWP